MYQYISLANASQLEQLGEIVSQSFASPLSKWNHYLNCIGRENFRIITQAERTIAGLAIYHLGQWFGGKQVTMAGIASVAVAPEYRGQGVANQLLKQTIQELHNRQIPISTLYPATQAPYRKLGYEQSGSFCKWKLSTTSIQLQERDLTIARIDPQNSLVFTDIYFKQAQYNNGNLARNEAIWQKVLERPEKGTLYAYLIGSSTQPEGYIIFTQEQEQISIRDWVLLTPSAARRVWTFLGDHRSQIKEVTWWGSPLNPFLLLLPEQTAKIVEQTIWMLRIVDLPAALALRGYPLGIEAKLHLDIQDDSISANNGKFCLQVSQGKGKVSQGGNGDFQINIRHLASLYTGLWSPLQLKQLNYLQTTPAALETANLIFTGDRPWSADFF